MHLPSTLLTLGLGLLASAAAFAEPDAVGIVDPFAIKLYQQIDSAPGNLFFSPLSIHTALAMVYAGSSGNTASQMKAVMQFAGEPDTLGDGYRKTLDAINSVPKVRTGDGTEIPAYELAIANALWGQKDFAFRPDYLAHIKDKYLGGLTPVDFKETEPTRLQINGWVEKQTKDKIKDLIPKGLLNTDTRLVLTNAIYFKSGWMNPFGERNTEDAPFNLADGSAVSVPTMLTLDRFGYASVDGTQIVDLPYQRGELSMTVFCPAKPDGLPNLEQSLSPALLATKVQHKRITLRMPKFKIDYSTPLSKELKKLGMTDAFNSEAADFSRMTTQEKLVISEVVHKAFIDVDEKGTEAAAATAVVMVRSAAMQKEDEPIEVKLDHPFLFVIRHRATGAILFMGRVSNPKG
jgi:serpin B